MNQPTVDGTPSFHEQEDEDDEEIDDEFRRAQEMALAVAALGGGGGTYSYQTAMDIRMAVADVMSGIGDDDRPNNTSTNNANKNAQYQQQQQQQDDDVMQLKRQLYAASRENHVQQARNEKLRRKIRLQEKQQQQQKKKKEQSKQQSQQQQQQQQKSDNFVFYLLASVWKDTVGPYVNPYLGPYLEFFDNKSLSGQNLFIVLLSMNGCILYLTTRPQSTLMSFWNAIFVLNMTVYICVTTTTTETVHKELDDDENKRFIPRQDSSGTISSDTDDDDDDDDPNKQKQQEELLLATAAAAVSKRPVSTIRLEWLDGIIFDENSILELEQLQPESTLAERRRFLKARKFCVKAASAQLGTYLQWRQDNRLDEFFPSTFLTTDTDDWISAARGALEIHNTTGGHVTVKSLPRLVSIFEGGDNSDDNIVVCKNGARLVHVLPCQLDSSLAQPSTYALAVAMYLDRKLNRNFTEKVTVVIDIRHGTGWKNPSSVSIVPFIKLVVGLLNTYFPERLSRCILFPLPRTATMLFNTAKTYLDPDTAAKIQVCSGGGSVKAVVPEKVFDFLSKKAVESMEKRRKSFFVIS